jgi:hypothetical protein
LPAAAAVARTDDGAALLARARERGAATQQGPARLGDLVVFDRVRGGRPASLVGVVVTTRPDATVEFIYLQRGVVRRGFLNLHQPSTPRNRAGRVLNTFVRGDDGGMSRNPRFLAGELFAAFIRLDRLTP